MSKTFHSITIDGLNIFYQKAGSRKNLTIVLHGYPASFQMYRDLNY